MARLHAIAPDEDAGPAPREPVHPAVQGLQRRIGHGACVGLTALSRLGWLELQRVVLDDGGAAFREVRGAYARHAPKAIERVCGRGPTAAAVTAAAGYMQAAGYRLNELGLEDDELGDALRVAAAADRLHWERVTQTQLVNWRSPKHLPVRARIHWRLDYDLSERFFDRLGSNAPRLSRLLWIVNPQRGGKGTPGGPLVGLLFTPLQRKPFDALADSRSADTQERDAFRREVQRLAGSA